MAGSWGLPSASALAEFNCYAVFVGGSESNMMQNSCQVSDGESIRFGKVLGFFPASAQVAIEVPMGERHIYLYGLKASSGCAALANGINSSNFSAPQEIGRATVQVGNGTNTVTISASLGAQTAETCSGPNIPGGWPTPVVAADFVWDFTSNANLTLVGSDIENVADILRVKRVHTPFSVGTHTDTTYAVVGGNEVLSLNASGVSAGGGIFESAIIDGGASLSWSTLRVQTLLPYGKELSAASESATHYPNLSTNLMNGLTGLWHFNEASYTGAANEVLDSSGNGLHGAAYNSATTTPSGKFNGAANFAATNYLLIGNSASLQFPSSLTASIWVYPTAWGSQNTIFMKTDGSTNGYALYTSGGGGALTAAAFTGGGMKVVNLAAGDIPLNAWTHIAMAFSNTQLKVYLNGALAGSVVTGSAINASTSHLRIGTWNGASGNWAGKMDEFALYNRTLSTTEVDHLYKRGAMNVKYQVRSCGNFDCSDATWKGPDGSNTSYFSELHNYSAIDANGDGTGSVASGPLAVNFSDFATAGLSIAANRYFQYRTVLETTTSTNPKVNFIKTNELYYGTQPAAILQGPAYTNLNSFTEIVGPNHSGWIYYQLSPDNGTTWYYHDGTTWTLASGQMNVGADVATHIGAFASEAGTGTLKIRAQFVSTGTEQVELDEVRVNYD